MGTMMAVTDPDSDMVSVVVDAGRETALSVVVAVLITVRLDTVSLVPEAPRVEIVKIC